jgi:hypothetical protein
MGQEGLTLRSTSGEGPGVCVGGGGGWAEQHRSLIVPGI